MTGPGTHLCRRCNKQGLNNAMARMLRSESGEGTACEIWWCSECGTVLTLTFEEGCEPVRGWSYTFKVIG